jgi:putative phage-type endonuclease
MKKIIDKRKMTEQDWQTYRTKQTQRLVIGGSEVATVLGVQPNYAKAPFILWLEKTGQKEPEQPDNDFIKWGNILEPVVRKQFAIETGFKVYQNNFVLEHDEHPFMIANIDGEVQDPSQKGRGVLEIKTTSEWNNKEWEGEKVPIAYMAQIQHYLAVTGYQYAYIVVLIGGNKLRWWFIDRDEEIINSIIQAEIDFLDKVKNEIPPTIGGTEGESQYIAGLYPDSIEEEMSIPQQIEDLANEYNELDELVKASKKRMESIKNQIKLEGKEFKTLKGKQYQIYMPQINKTLFDQKRFSEEQPELHRKYKTKISSYRDFKIKAIGGN